MTLPWEDNKELIIQLYIRDRRRLVDVRDIMRQHHNFRASVRSYRQHFDRWKVGKYRCRRRQWERPDSPGLGSGNGEMMAVSSTPPPLRHPLSPASSSTTEIFPPAPYPVDPSLSMGPAMGYSFLTQAGRGYGSGGSNKSNNNGNVIGEPYHSPFNDYAQFEDMEHPKQSVVR
ncbi:hypothetical protein N3K66_004843 [Trichothecium roseum]|uniref:Uncharacterized protein n=1 Tax=Trichothecium roseum TaxID=47278 RepID=A0ACC0V355_9HYPO|nr:hypothetical protein N3K66_004843 [Trichothecium roseum]